MGNQATTTNSEEMTLEYWMKYWKKKKSNFETNELTCLQEILKLARDDDLLNEDHEKAILCLFIRQHDLYKRLNFLRKWAIKFGHVDQLRHLLKFTDQHHMDHSLMYALKKAPAKKRQEIIQLLLNKSDYTYTFSANPKFRSEGEPSLHLASVSGYKDLLPSLSSVDDSSILNSIGQTALHCTVRKICDLENCPEKEAAQIINLIKCVEVLVENLEIDINARENSEYTAVHIACKGKSWTVVKYLVEKRANIDTVIEGTTAREIITSQHPKIELVSIPVTEGIPLNIVKETFKILESRDESKLINQIKSPNFNINVNNGMYTLLQGTVEHGLNKATRKLLDLGADVNERCGNLNTPIMIAVNNCNVEMLELLLSYKSVDLTLFNSCSDLQTVLHLAVLEAKPDCQCVRLLCEKETLLNIDSLDYKNKSALHYAVEKRHKLNILYLLKANANIFVCDKYLSPAFIGIDIDMLKWYLDNQINPEKKIMMESNEEKNTNKTLEENETHLNFDFLATPRMEITKNSRTLNFESNTGNDANINIPPSVRSCPAMLNIEKLPAGTNLLTLARSSCPAMLNTETLPTCINIPSSRSKCPDMKNLIHLADSKKYKSLLTHPVIRSFLHLKWHMRYKRLYISTLVLVAAFTISFTSYTYLLLNDATMIKNQTYNNATSVHVNESTNYGFVGALICTVIMWLLLMVFKYFTSKSFIHCICNLNNIIEIVLIFCAPLLLLLFMIPYDSNVILITLSAISVILSFLDLATVLGSHPNLTIYYRMLFKIFVNFLYFLISFSLLIIGFGISFYILFHVTVKEKNCSGNLFQSVGTSIFKTIMMLQGEIDVNGLEFHFVFSYFIVIFFIFSIVIVLMNLLNGLAVFDIQTIQNDAEVICLKSQVHLCAKFDKIRNSRNSLFNSKWCKCWDSKCCDSKNEDKCISIYKKITENHVVVFNGVIVLLIYFIELIYVLIKRRNVSFYFVLNSKRF